MGRSAHTREERRGGLALLANAPAKWGRGDALRSPRKVSPKPHAL